MQMLYNSDSFAVVQIQVPVPGAASGAATDTAPGGAADGSSAFPGAGPLVRDGFEIVDKAAQREIFIEGALAERFQQGVEALVESGERSEEAFDDFIAGYAGFAQQALVYH